MTFKELKDIIFNYIDETDYDEQVEIIVESAINEAYQTLCKEDKRILSTTLYINNGVARLPDNLLSIVKCTPDISDDLIVGNSILTDKQGTIDMVYTYVRDKLIKDNDELDLHETLCNTIPDFVCYKYFSHRKKIDIAQNFLNTHMLSLNEYKNDIKTRVQDATGSIETIKFVG